MARQSTAQEARPAGLNRSAEQLAWPAEQGRAMTSFEPGTAGDKDVSGQSSEGAGWGTRPAAVQLRSRRNPRLVAVGVLMACIGGLSGGLLWQQQSHSRSVLVVTHNVAKGQVVQSGDLTTTSIGVAPGVAAVPANALSSVVGKSALVDLGQGSLLSPESVGQLSAPMNAEHVGLKLDAGRVPTTAMTPGTQVRLVPVPGSSTDSNPPGEPVDAVLLTAPQLGATGESVVFDVAVSPADSVRVTQLAARNQLAVVRKAGQ